jgi:hypothetical protein
MGEKFKIDEVDNKKQNYQSSNPTKSELENFISFLPQFTFVCVYFMNRA